MKLKPTVPDWAWDAARKVAEWEYETFKGEGYGEHAIHGMAMRIEESCTATMEAAEAAIADRIAEAVETERARCVAIARQIAKRYAAFAERGTFNTRTCRDSASTANEVAAAIEGDQ